MTYSVQSGDSLSSIAKKFTGDWTRWIELLPINGGKVRNPDANAAFDVSKNVVSVGTILDLPAKWTGSQNINNDPPAVGPSDPGFSIPWVLVGPVALLVAGYYLLD